jgi:hypothetical protein
MLWAGRIISGLVVLFMIVDGGMKVARADVVLKSFAELGYRESLAPGIGIVLLVCTLIYIIPRTSVLGAILLTAYLGGATATHVRAGGPVFPIVFSITFGVLVWLGLYLRDERLRKLIPLRK